MNNNPIHSELIGSRYKILKELGKGGMGLVYLVSDTLKDNMIFALKTIKQEIIEKYETLSKATFKNEYEIMTRLKHPNLSRVYDFGDYQDNYYIVMEFIDGHLINKC